MSPSSSKKTITIDASSHRALTDLKEDLKEKLGGRITYSMVVRSLLNNHIELENVKSEMRRIKEEADETQRFIKDLLSKAVGNSAKVVTVQQSPPGMQMYPQQQGYMMQPPPGDIPSSGNYNPPPAPPAPAPPPKIEYEDIEADGEVKDAFSKETRAIFDGVIRKPSDILKVTNPNHAKNEVKEYKGKVPSLIKKSHALKNADKFRKEKKRVL